MIGLPSAKRVARRTLLLPLETRPAHLREKLQTDPTRVSRFLAGEVDLSPRETDLLLELLVPKIRALVGREPKPRG